MLFAGGRGRNSAAQGQSALAARSPAAAFDDKTRFRGSTENLHVIERLTRVDDKTLLYRFTVEDSDTWDRPWAGEYIWPATSKPIYEYACHEGNYALANVLRGARRQEAGQAAVQAKK
jgi:hypothetical protein